MRRAWIWGVVFVAGAVAVALVQGDGATLGPSGGSSALPWVSDLPTALSRAGTENKLVMVDFYADWCQWCKRLDQNTFSDAKVQKALASVVTVRLNGERDGREAAARFDVERYPTVIFLNASGVEVGRIPGYMDPGPFLAELQDILNKA
jgi:thiol:disulfide interchange protein